MTTWAGWAADFLAAAKLPDTAENRKFLGDWATHADAAKCANNPIDLSMREPGSRDCGPPRAHGQRAQRYTSHSWARTAFAGQLAERRYSFLRAALENGNPYSVGIYTDVVKNLGAWGSTIFANVYLQEMVNQVQPSGAAAKTHKGFAALQHSFNRVMPESIATARRSIDEGLRALDRARKVRL